MMALRIHPDRDEGQSGDPRAIEGADIRARVRKLIEGPRGEVDIEKAKALGRSFTVNMHWTTIVNFALNKTKNPAGWTWYQMSLVADYQMGFFPRGSQLPKGTILV